VKTYEVFLKKPGRDPFEHAGSLDAPDDELAIVLARETYTRRAEGSEMWLVERTHVLAVEEGFIAVNAGRDHRHNDGAVVAERRRRKRAEAAEASP